MPQTSPLRVVIAPDSFSGTLSAVQAAAAIAEGWQAVRPHDEITITPMSDGGLGLLDVVAAAHPSAARHHTEVADARGVATTAAWLLLQDGTAVVETAQAISLHALAAEARDPLRTTSYGVGQLLLDVAATAGVGRVIVGLGGSATVDGGVGMISAMTDHAVRRADGNGVKVGGRWVAEASDLRITAQQPFHRLAAMPLTVAADVRSPLTGPMGAARVFGPQKGASPAAVRELEHALQVWADVVQATVQTVWQDTPGTGAAGGIGFAIAAILGGQLVDGAEVVAQLVGLDATGADVVVTGEGRLDSQTHQGKAPWLVASHGRQAGARVLAVAGQVDDPSGFDDAEALGESGLSDPHGSAVRAAAALASRLTDQLNR